MFLIILDSLQLPFENNFSEIHGKLAVFNRRLLRKIKLLNLVAETNHASCQVVVMLVWFAPNKAHITQPGLDGTVSHTSFYNIMSEKSSACSTFTTLRVNFGNLRPGSDAELFMSRT